MDFLCRACAVVAVVGLTLALSQATAAENGTHGGEGRVARSIPIDTTIDPASASWLKEALEKAEDDGVYLVIVRLDTPGGLDTAMRDMIKHMIAAPMPVVVYVSPDGARAASAGLYITQAADVASMAPQTNIGSATPITIGPGGQDRVLGRKIRNDAAAYVRALAEGHGRNPDLAEEMVRKAVNVTAAVADRRGLIDLVATDQRDLLRVLDGYRVKGPKAQTLQTDGVRLELRERPFKFQVLGFLVNPTIAFLLLLLGLAGIGFEIFNPGAILPGALGGVSLILALFGLAELPINVAGALLVLFAFGLFVAEALIVSHGALGAAGVVSLAAGGLMLFDTDSSAFSISVPIVIFSAAVIGGFFVFVIGKAIQARHRRVYTGWEELIGDTGEVRSRLDPAGQIFIQGALWQATTGDDTTIPEGDRVVVDRVEGLKLIVHREDES